MNYINQLNTILKVTGWSQEKLASELTVSFPALNAWINKRATPRNKAQDRIAALYVSIIGSEAVDEAELANTKREVRKLNFTVKKLLGDKKTLDLLTLHWTYHTNTIEGSTMTLSDVKDVIFDHKVLSNRTLIEQTEARNHQATLYWLLDKIAADGKKFLVDENLILDLHVRLMNGLIANAGQYRKHSVRIMGTYVPLANWQRIPESINELVASSRRITDKDVMKNLAEYHAKFEKIHPFSDGNGRTGRLLLLAQALSAGYIPPLIVRERKQAYYKYLEIAQTKEKYEPLELFIAQSMQYCHKLLV